MRQLALGLCLFGLACSSGAAAIDRDAAQPDGRARIATERDVLRDHTKDQPGDQRRTAAPAPAETNPHEAQAAERRAKEADDREAANLKLQERLAAAAEGQERIAWWQGLFSFVGMLVAIGGAIMLWRTFGETQRTAQAGIRAADAAGESAKLAEAALEVSRSTAQLQLRPVVSHDYAQLSTEQGAATVKVQVKNYGATSAEGMRINLAALIADWPLEVRPPLPKSAYWSPPVTLPPGHTSVLELAMPEVDTEQRTRLYRSLSALLLTARAEYTGPGGLPYETSVDLIAIGHSSAEGRVAIYNPDTP